MESGNAATGETRSECFLWDIFCKIPEKDIILVSVVVVCQMTSLMN